VNGLAPRCEAQVANVFDWLKAKSRRDAGGAAVDPEKFDLIVLDPPSFTRSRSSVPDALRGYKDTRVPMVINTFAYWLVGFPLAYIAAVILKLPPNYVWAGFIAGLCTAAILLGWRYAIVSKRYL